MYLGFGLDEGGGEAIALAAYFLLGLWATLFITADAEHYEWPLAIWVLSYGGFVVAVYTNVESFRTRLPVFSSSNHAVTAVGWAGLLVFGIVSFFAIKAVSPRNLEWEARAPERAAAATALAITRAEDTSKKEAAATRADEDRRAAAGATSAAQAVAAATIAARGTEQTASSDEHIANARDYLDEGNTGLGLVEIDQALAINRQSQEAQNVRQSIVATATAAAQAAAAEEARVAAVSASATREALADAAVAATKTAFDNRIASAQRIDPREIVGDPNRFTGRNVALQGNALNVTQYGDYTWVQLMAVVPGRSTTESLVVEFRLKDTKILKDECIRVYATAAGTQKVTRALTGAENEVPKLDGYYWTSSPRGAYGIGCE